MNSSDIETLFLNIVKSVADVNPAYMNWSLASIQDVVSNSSFRFYKTEQNEIASMICFQSNSEFVEILALGTLPEYQRQGFSEKLLNQFLSECSGTSKFVTLEVHCENLPAIALYEKCGFKTVRIRKNYYSDGSHALVMDK